MLYHKTVEPHTFSILKELMVMPELSGFSLVGGTALSLLYGHRQSVDLDLFSSEKFESENLSKILFARYQSKFVLEDKPAAFGVFCYIDNVKVDFVKHPHPLIRPLQEAEGFRMFSTEDIIAMKVQAILGRGKKKDFWDIAELLNHFSVSDFVRLHKEKYTTQNLLITVPQVMTYFADADEDEDPVSLKNQTWQGVQESISVKVREYLK